MVSFDFFALGYLCYYQFNVPKRKVRTLKCCRHFLVPIPVGATLDVIGGKWQVASRYYVSIDKGITTYQLFFFQYSFRCKIFNVK